MTIYRARADVEIEAERWSTDHHKSLPFGEGHHLRQRAQEIVAWVNANGGEARYTFTPPAQGETFSEHRIAVRTINGWVMAEPGHYIVMGDAAFRPGPGLPGLRDFYPCYPETFNKRWEVKP